MQQKIDVAGGIDGSGLTIPISHSIWRDKYRYETDVDVTRTWWRVAEALASAEKPDDRVVWAGRFYDALSDFKFIPAGRVIGGAGTGRSVTLFNCFVMGTIHDSMDGIFSALRESALTMQQGGGIGNDFSTLRPKGAPVKGVGADASGPLTFMDTWDAMCRTVMSAGSRRGAMMGTMRCDHPDIEAFIDAKRDAMKLRMFNLSVLVTDAFMDAVKDDGYWDLQFDGKVYKRIEARHLWDKIMRSTYETAEPGVIFVDRVNEMNNLNYCENISATNPCGEQPLPPYGACLLGSINLAAMVQEPFQAGAGISTKKLRELSSIAVRMLDNVIDISNYPLPQQGAEAKAKRRIGIGITGLADALAMCRLHYGTEEARKQAARWMQAITEAAYHASWCLAKEKGKFPMFDVDAWEPGVDINLAEGHKYALREYGMRNSHLTSIAPTGTISLLAGNVSSGIEPIFDYQYERKVLEPDGSKRIELVQDFAYRMWCEKYDTADTLHGLPDYFVTAHTLDPEAHVLMQAALQPFVDSAISKTINCPPDISFEEFQGIYTRAYVLGLKGCTTYRPNDITGSILSSTKEEKSVSVEDMPAAASGDLVAEIKRLADIVARPLPPRAAVMSGRTYKLSWPNSPAFYVTINDDADGNPFEIFINSKNLDAYAWTLALTRMISAIWRRGGNTAFVQEELKAVFDPRGGSWMDGSYCPSLLAAIGGIIEQHIGRAPEQQQDFEVKYVPARSPDGIARPTAICPKCSSTNLESKPGCKTCRDCGFSTCA